MQILNLNGFVKTTLAAGILAAATLTAVPVSSQEMTDPVRAEYLEALKGREVVFLPISMFADLAQGWFAGLKSELEPLGVSVTVRDPNFSSEAGAQALEALIGEKPDVIVVQNPDVQTYARLIQKAEKEGIIVIQLNMQSAYKSTAYVGIDWLQSGQMAASAVVEACAGKSGKVAVVQGALSAAASAFTFAGVKEVLDANPQIELVANQAANWDATKAKQITQTVIKQHPDICGMIGFWDGQDIGIVAALKEAGKTEDVFLVTQGAGEQGAACDLVKNGSVDLNLASDAIAQARDVADMIKWLLHSGAEAGSLKGSIYNTIIPITEETADSACWSLK